MNGPLVKICASGIIMSDTMVAIAKDNDPFKYIFMDISGYSKALREALFSQVEYLDEYRWYLGLDDNETETGDHYIVVRTLDVEALNKVFESLSERDDYFSPVRYKSDVYTPPEYRPSVYDRFQKKYPK